MQLDLDFARTSVVAVSEYTVGVKEAASRKAVLRWLVPGWR